MTLKQIAVFHSPVSGKFGLSRQAGIAPCLKGQVELMKEFAHEEALRGIDGFDYIWLVWGFNLNRHSNESSLTVRPPRLGGNERVGVFASRSPFRPNPLGLSSVRIESVDFSGGIINVLGADLADGTPIYDIKPYLAYTDSHPDAGCGYVDRNPWEEIEVIIPDTLPFSDEETDGLHSLLKQDPRPRGSRYDGRTFGFKFCGKDVRFKVSGGKLIVLETE